MFQLVAVLMVVEALLCLPCWYHARRSGTLYGSDFGLALLPIPLWLLMSGLGVGAQSLANVVELVFVGFFVPFALAARLFVLDHLTGNPRLNSRLTLVACLSVVVTLRLLMPTIPE